MTAAKIDLFARPEPPRAHHQESGEPDQDQPRYRDPPSLNRNSIEKMHCSGQQARGSGNWHSHKILAIRPARISRLWIVADIESRQPRCTADQKQKADEWAGLNQVLAQLRIDRVRQKIKAPHIRKQAGSHAKRNHIRQRIELPAEIARRIGHPRDASIERIKGNGYKNGDRCKSKCVRDRFAIALPLMAAMVCVIAK